MIIPRQDCIQLGGSLTVAYHPSCLTDKTIQASNGGYRNMEILTLAEAVISKEAYPKMCCARSVSIDIEILSIDKTIHGKFITPLHTSRQHPSTMFIIKKIQ